MDYEDIEFVTHPGHVKAHDGEVYFLSHIDLCKLYKASRARSIPVHRVGEFWGDGKIPPEITQLHPRIDCKYPLFNHIAPVLV